MPRPYTLFTGQWGLPFEDVARLASERLPGQAMATAGVCRRLRRSWGAASSLSWAERMARTAVSNCAGGRVKGTRR